MPAHPLGVGGRFERIFGCNRVGKQIFQHGADKRKSFPGGRFLLVFALLLHLPHLSVQLMQGSMVRISSATSASWQPLSISSIGGMLLVVGVRSRNLSRYLVPFALT